MPESLNRSLSELEKEYQFVDYIPPPPLSYVWKAFWKIRRTKSFENPINFTDLKDYAYVNRMEWDIWETEVVLQWDKEYYNAIKKHKEQ